jgi:23S rRNA (uracil1939-C5)-methyltransferase
MPIRVTTGEAMAYGPHAVARRNGKVIFVRGGAPCEEAEIVVREDRGNYAYADLLTVLRPSPVRRQPPCPYLPRCGGCPWQHLAYEAQLVAKHTVVREQIRRIAHLDLDVRPVLPSPLEFGYRQRLKLRVAEGRVGFLAGGTHSLVDIDHCLLAEPEVAAAIPTVRTLVAMLCTRIRRIEIASGADPGPGLVVAAEAEGSFVAEDERHCRSWLDAHPSVSGLTISGRRWLRSWGGERLLVRPEADLSLSVRVGTFTQVNPEANRRLVDLVLNLAEPRTGQNILDLYAGAGNFSLPLARRGALVRAVDHDRRAIEDGKENAQRLGLEGCGFEHGNVAQAAANLARSGEHFALAILDPPRSGAAEALDALMRLAPDRVIYISCDPSTLARDLARLASQYRFGCVRALDMFPHTYHVENVVDAALI